MARCLYFQDLSVQLSSSEVALSARMPPSVAEPVRWGPDNPHPLFGRKTELVWDGKYDEYGARRPVDIAGSAMPMQKIETVDMPRSEALAGGQTTLGELKTTRQDDFGKA